MFQLLRTATGTTTLLGPASRHHGAQIGILRTERVNQELLSDLRPQDPPLGQEPPYRASRTNLHYLSCF